MESPSQPAAFIRAQHFALVYSALTLAEFYLFSKISFGKKKSLTPRSVQPT